MKAQKLVLLLSILVLIYTQEPVVVVSKQAQEYILDTEDLANHLNNNQQVRAFIVETTASDQSELTEITKEVLKKANVNIEDVNSFLAEHQGLKNGLGNLVSKFQKVTTEQLYKALSEDNSEAVMHFTRRRLQETQTDQKSLLFLNMTPSVLSGLLVGLFLIIVLLIGISCLYNVKTNDKFAKNNLWVGKQS